ncbi:MAG: PD-(D/E)XK nuclease family protein [Deltaproteobacteria bacterium]|nr:PD-(D/E)XK nuclease family protein [Deltaproteobacteria bacterium]
MNTSYKFLGAKDAIISFLGNTLLESSSLQNNLIVFPGKRPSYFLRKYLAEKLTKAYEPPLIFSIDEFISFWLTTAGIVWKEAADIDAVAILYKEFEADIGAVVGKKKQGISLDEFFPWGIELFKAFEELKIQRVPMDKIRSVDAYFEDKPFFKNKLKRFSVTFHRFSSIYERFYGFLKDSQIMTRSMLYSELASRMEQSSGFLSKFENIIIAGFFSFTESEKDILAFLKHLPNVSFVFQKGPGLNDTIKFLDINDESLNKDIDWSDCTITFHRASDSHAQIFMLNDIVNNEKRTFSAKDVIVVPEPGLLFPVVNWTLPFVSNDYNISMGYPIVSTPVYSMLENIFEVQEKANDGRYPVDTYLKLMLHPYIKNIKCADSSEVSRIIIHGLEEALSVNLGKTIALDAIERGDYKIKANGTQIGLLTFCARQVSSVINLSEDAIAGHLRLLHDNAIRTFEAMNTISEFTSKILDLISLISKKSTANLHEYYDEFVYSLIEYLHKLKLSRLGALKFEDKAAYFGLIRSYLKGLSVPFKGTPLRGLQILGFLETRNLRFDSVYFLDANEGIIPAGRKEDSILPHEIRKHLNLVTYKTTEAIYKYYFYLLLTQAKQSHVFYLDNQDKEPSRLVQRILWDMQRENKYVKEDEASLEVSFSQNNPSGVPKTKQMLEYLAENKRISPSSMDNYLQCPLSFYYRHVLGFEERTELTSDFEARDIGIIVHEILQIFFDPTRGKAKSLDKIVDDVFTKNYSDHEDGFSYIVKSQIKSRLSYIINHYGAEQGKNVILEVESWYDMPYKTGDYDIQLIGKIDRIDRRGEDIHIIDYKTGASSDVPSKDLTDKDFDESNREDWKNKIKSVQLPFYIKLYRHKHPEIKIEQIEATLLMLGNPKLEGMETNLFNRGSKVQIDKKHYYETCLKVIDALINEIFDLTIPFKPTDAVASCKNCPCKAMCSRQWT